MRNDAKEAVALRVAASDWEKCVPDHSNGFGLQATERLNRAAVRYVMAKKRGYSDEFPTTREKRVYFMLDKIPPALWIRVKAKAKREGVSLRSLILKWCQEWVER